MGDRTYLSMHVHPDDLNKVAWKDFVETWGESEEAYGDPHNYWFASEMNYAGYEALMD